MAEDKQLIAQYAANGAEAPFAELVRRHLNLVYATALRLVNGDSHLAEDISQSVFAELARKAKDLSGAASIAGWLYTSARFAAAKAVRSESRRRAREEAATAMIDTSTKSPDGSSDLQAVVGDALDQLDEKEREAIILRYFESSEFAAVGEALGISQNAARMRVERSLDKLRGILEKRGLTTTAAVLAATLSEWAAKAAPAELAATVIKSALAQSAVAAAPLPLSSKVLALLHSKLIAGAAAFAILAATVFMARHTFLHTPDDGPALAASTKRPNAAVIEPGALDAPKGDPNAFQKLLQRHDARAQADRASKIKSAEEEWNKAAAEFADSLKDEPGTKKFGAKKRVTLASGQTLVTGGWEIGDGKRIVTLMTPAQVDLSGNPAPAGASYGRIMMTGRFLEGSDSMFDNLGLQSLNTTDKESSLSENLSAAQMQAILQAVTNNSAVPSAPQSLAPDLVASSVPSADNPTILATPRALTADYVGAGVSIVDENHHLNLEMSVLPIQSFPDGSMDLGLMVKLKLPATAQNGASIASDASKP